MLGQRTAPGAPLFRPGLAQRRFGFVLFGLARGNCLFEIFQSQVELVGIELFPNAGRTASAAAGESGDAIGRSDQRVDRALR
jgi:hypothetical protein